MIVVDASALIDTVLRTNIAPVVGKKLFVSSQTLNWIATSDLVALSQSVFSEWENNEKPA